jgi:uncharacterized protein YndB with AHSA1/START domain
MTTEQRDRTAVLTTPSDREIQIQRVFDAPRELLFAVYTDPALVSDWWGPRTTAATVEEMDVRPGGRWRIAVTDSDGSPTGFHGEYREVEAPRRLVQTFEWEGLPGHVSVETATLEDLGETTRLTVVSRFDSTEDRDGMLASGMEDGLKDSWARLDEPLGRVRG